MSTTNAPMKSTSLLEVSIIQRISCRRRDIYPEERLLWVDLIDH